MMANLRDIIPGAAHWPKFVRNVSEQYEARVALVRVERARRCCSTACTAPSCRSSSRTARGRPSSVPTSVRESLEAHDGVALRYVDTRGRATQVYPANPNGSTAAIASVCSADGRVTITMPHPERVFRTVQNSWAPAGWGEDGGWMRLFRNARVWLG